jgi:hypothetical protein
MDFFCSFCRLTRVLTHVFGSDRLVHKQIQRSYSSSKQNIKSSAKSGLVNHESQKVWAFVVNQKGQNLHHDQAFFPPILIN